MFRDPLVRRFISASFFAAAFVWVAVYFFDVDPEVVWVLLGFSFLFVLGLIVIGFLLAPVVRLFRPKSSLLSKADLSEEDSVKEKNSGTSVEDSP